MLPRLPFSVSSCGDVVVMFFSHYVLKFIILGSGADEVGRLTNIFGFDNEIKRALVISSQIYQGWGCSYKIPAIETNYIYTHTNSHQKRQ